MRRRLIRVLAIAVTFNIALIGGIDLTGRTATARTSQWGWSIAASSKLLPDLIVGVSVTPGRPSTVESLEPEEIDQ